MNLLHLTAKELKQAARVKEKIVALEKELEKLIGMEMEKPFVQKAKRKFSAAGRLAIIAAQKLRWANVKKDLKPKIKKRVMSAAAKAKIAAAAKKRWAKAKAAGKKSL